jgi:hypothetical protein
MVPVVGPTVMLLPVNAPSGEAPGGATKLTVPPLAARLIDAKKSVEPAAPFVELIVALPERVAEPRVNAPMDSLDAVAALPRKLNVPPFIVSTVLLPIRPPFTAGVSAMLVPVLSRVSVPPWLIWMADVVRIEPLPFKVTVPELICVAPV